MNTSTDWEAIAISANSGQFTFRYYAYAGFDDNTCVTADSLEELMYDLDECEVAGDYEIILNGEPTTYHELSTYVDSFCK